MLLPLTHMLLIALVCSNLFSAADNSHYFLPISNSISLTTVPPTSGPLWKFYLWILCQTLAYRIGNNQNWLAKLLFKFHLLLKFRKLKSRKLKSNAWTYLLVWQCWQFSRLSEPMYLAGADLAAHTEHYPVSELVFEECLQSAETLMICMPINHGEHHCPL